MDYFVIGPDGKEYGPASIDTLKTWVTETRILPTTMLKNYQSGQTVEAGTIPDLFPSTPPPTHKMAPPADWSRPPTPAAAYPRSAPAQPSNAGNSDIAMALLRSVLALVFFFVLKGIGLIVGVYGIVWAFRAKEKGHKLANVAIAISILTLVIIGIGWALRLGGNAI